MKAASEFENTTALSHLPPTKIFALLDLSQEEREQFVNDHDVESMTTRELAQALKDKKELEKKLKAAEKAAEAVEKLKNELEETRRQLSEAQASGNDEEAGRLQESLDKTDKELTEAHVRIKELEQQLKDKPIEATAAPVIERIPEEVQKELDELRRGQPSAGALKFTVYFDALVKSFKELLGALAELEGTDQEAYERYKKAVTGLVGKMSERL
jgi:DNA repair exonuclease SbcCD ATPase subunit